MDTIFSSPLGQIILLFLLIFTVVFAILQKSGILGKDKKQIDALVALAIGLIVVGASQVLDFAQKLIPFMAISMIIILVFMILLAMFFQTEIKFHDNVRIAFGILVFIAVVIAVLVFTGSWEPIKNWFTNSSTSGNIILVVVIVGAILLAYFGPSGAPSGKPNST